jgi:predicted transcriptional regulator
MRDWNMISFILASKVRLKALVALSKSASTPSNISKELHIQASQISVVLRELMEKGLIKCLTPERRKGKLYKITERGKRVLNEVSEYTAIR